MMEAGDNGSRLNLREKGEDHMHPAKREDYTEMLLAEGGKARCTVVIAEDAGEKVRAAAEDFGTS